MEIRNYFRTIRRFIWWLVVPLVVVMILTFVFSLIFNTSYEAPAVFAINRKSQQKETPDYQYDSYYAIQANNMLADQFTEWLKGGSILPAVYERAGLKQGKNLLLNEWKVTDHSPQDIEMIFRGRDKDRVSSLAKAAVATVSDKSEEFTGSGESAIGTVTLPSEIVVMAKEASLSLNLAVSFLAGLIIGLIFVYFKAIFDRNGIQNPKS